jgi:hypothetical protein
MYQGMLGFIGATGIVRNLGLVSVSINSSSNSVGGIAGQNNGTISNCYVTGTIKAVSNVGGIAGYNHSIVQNCYSAATVEGTSNYVGGIVGTSQYGGASIAVSKIENCYSTGTVSGIYTVIDESYTDTTVGGIVGYVNNTASVFVLQNCYSTATVSGNFSVGGIIGASISTSIPVQNCVVLNKSITRSGLTNAGNNSDNMGRVAGNNSAFVNNYARSDMLYYSAPGATGTTTFPGTFNPSLTSKDGQSITPGSGTTQSQAWWTNAGNWTSGGAWDFTNVWEMGTNGLPILRNMPQGAQNHTLP